MSDNYSPAGGNTDHVSDSGLERATPSNTIELRKITGASLPVAPPVSSAVKLIPIVEVRVDRLTQTRVRIDYNVVEEYAEAMLAGAVFPPVIAFSDGQTGWLADGFHRLEAASKAGRNEILAEIRSGGRQEAFRFALGANAAHGLPRNHADKRNAVTMALREFPKLSDRQIAELCAVGHQLVARIRPQVDESSTSMEFRLGRDGKRHPAKKATPQRDKLPANELPTPHPQESAVPTPQATEGVAEASVGVIESLRSEHAAEPAGVESIIFEFADGTKFLSHEWVEGILSAASVQESLAGFTQPSNGQVSSVGLVNATGRQRLFVAMTSSLNAVLGHEPSEELLADVREMVEATQQMLAKCRLFHGPISSVTVNPMEECLLPEEPSEPGDPQDVP